jgi:hypothetical protein
VIEDRIKGVENSKSTRVTDAKGAKVKQLLHDFLSHPWMDCKEAADGADGRAECGIPGDQLGLEPLPLSKIRDGSAERNERPRGAAVFDF